MQNTEIAAIFEEIAELLEIKGDDRFRIRSYRNAAVAIEGMTEGLKERYDSAGEAGLTGISGIGKGLRDKIIEMLSTGRCSMREELLKEIPAGVLEMMKVSGVGPKKAALMYEKLGIASVDDLEKAAKGHKLHDLPGLGEKTEQNIIKGVRNLRAVSGRFTISTALMAAHSIMERIKRVPGVTACESAGSLRRWKDSIGDVDILAIAKDAPAVMDAFIAHPDVKDVAAKGETKSTVILRSGLQVDLRVLDKSAFGAAMQYFTGSKEHNVVLRDRAKRMGLKISEYGVFRESDNKLVAGATEESVYRAVKLPYIEPELRENRGEIIAAEKGELPQLVELKDIKGDLHVHTAESDGSASLDELAQAAIAYGYEYMAVTDHSKAVGIAHGLDEKRALAQIAVIDKYNEKLTKAKKKFRFLKGSEVDIRADGSLDHSEDVLSKLDCVVASIHSGFNMPRAEMTARIIKGFASGFVNIFAHPTGRLIGIREAYDVDIEAVLHAARKYGVWMEVNSSPERLDLNDVHCKRAIELGVGLVASTDAHATAQLTNMHFGVHTLRRGWAEKKDVMNTRGLKEMQKLLSKK